MRGRWRYLWLAIIPVSTIPVLLTLSSGLGREDLPQKRLMYTIPGMDTVEGRCDLSYAQADGADLKIVACAVLGMVGARIYYLILFARVLSAGNTGTSRFMEQSPGADLSDSAELPLGNQRECGLFCRAEY